jgi:hypothetical protein
MYNLSDDISRSVLMGKCLSEDERANTDKNYERYRFFVSILQ